MEKSIKDVNDVFITSAICGCKLSMVFTGDPSKPVKNIIIECPCKIHKK